MKFSALPRRTLLLFVVIIALLTLNSGVTYFNTIQLINNDRWVTHTYKVITNLETILSLVKDAETGGRGFVITGQDSYLVPFTDAENGLTPEIDRLAEFTKDNPAQAARIPVLRDQIAARLALSRQAISLRRSGGFASAQRFVSTGAGKAEMDSLRQTISLMLAEESTLLSQRGERQSQSAMTAMITEWAAFLASLSLVLCVGLLLLRSETQKSDLDAAYAKLKSAESLRDSLTEMLVHDLRTPLTAMLGGLEVLKGEQSDTLTPDQQKELIGISTQGGYRLLGLINELLDIGKMEAGEMKIRRQTVQVPAVVEEAVTQVRSADARKTARIVEDLEPSLPLVQADHELLTRILINLVGNALKFTPRTGTVTVGAHVIHPLEQRIEPAIRRSEAFPAGNPNPVMLVFVRDTGEGIPKEDQARIFEKFGQVESRKAGRKMSTGLGLTFCKLAVEAHQGKIWVESEPGQGSTFFFTIPLRPWEQEREESDDLKAEAAAQ